MIISDFLVGSDEADSITLRFLFRDVLGILLNFCLWREVSFEE